MDFSPEFPSPWRRDLSHSLEGFGGAVSTWQILVAIPAVGH
jgi:hypothetical protein